MVETAALVLALLALGGGIAYNVMASRPGVPVRPRQGPDGFEELVGLEPRPPQLSSTRSIAAFRINPYKAETRTWRNRILLEQAERRALLLDSPVQSHFNEPKTDGERQYVEISDLARKKSERGDDRAAAKALGRAGPHGQQQTSRMDRQWSLLAQKRANELKVKVAKRRVFVERELKRIEEAKRAGKLGEAEERERREHLVRRTTASSRIWPISSADSHAPVNDAGARPCPHASTVGRLTPNPLRQPPEWPGDGTGDMRSAVPWSEGWMGCLHTIPSSSELALLRLSTLDSGVASGNQRSPFTQFGGRHFEMIDD